MDQRRFLLFISLSLLIWLGWNRFVIRKFFPPPTRGKPGGCREPDAEDKLPPADALVAENVPLAADNVRPEPAGVPKNPLQTVTLGSMDPQSGYFLHVELTTLGEAIRTIELNDLP